MQILRLLKQTWLEWYESRAFELGAALAFYAVFSVAPVIVLAFTAASLVLGGEMALGRLTQEVESTVGHTVAVAIQATAQLVPGSGWHHVSLWCSQFDRDRPALGLLFFAGPPVRRGVHTGLRQTPRCASGTERTCAARHPEGTRMIPDTEPLESLICLRRATPYNTGVLWRSSSLKSGSARKLTGSRMTR